MNEVAITTIKNQIEALSNEGKALVITDNASYGVAGEFLKKIKQAQKNVDDTRKGMTRPIDEAKSKIMDLFRPVEARIKDIEASVKRSLLEYQRIVDEKIRLEREAQDKKDAEELAQKQKDAEFFGDNEPIEIEPSKIEDMPVNVAPVVSGISTKLVWTYNIIDENKIPREFCSPDPKKISGAISFGVREVEGLRIYQEKIISSRR
jgi:hypothetical protein